jgi:anaerobic ribonucleoside-triphosphate reductase activating protein
LRINNIIFPSYNSSDGLSVDLFLAGCARKPKCKNCQNPDLWDFDNGEEYSFKSLSEWLVMKSDYYDNIVILGGEPVDHDDLSDLLIRIYHIKPIWLYSSYELNEIPNEIKQYCDYIKTGRYVEELKTGTNFHYGINLISGNQQIYKKGLDY